MALQCVVLLYTLFVLPLHRVVLPLIRVHDIAERPILGVYPECSTVSAMSTRAEELLELGSATLGESGGRVTHPRLGAAWHGARIAGPVIPVRCTPGDNLAIHVAVAKGETGGVLTVDVGSTHHRGYWGEVLTTAAESRGIGGLVIDGGVRDVDALAAHNFPVFSSTIALRGATKRAPGSVGHAVRVGGALVERGDWVVADADGVVIIPGARLDEVLAAGRARAEKERGFFASLQEGATTVELLQLDNSLISVVAG